MRIMKLKMSALLAVLSVFSLFAEEIVGRAVRVAEKNDWQAKCDAWAEAYYNAVKVAGQDAYKDRQLKACECSCSKRDLRFGAYDAKLEHYYPPIKP